MDISSVAEDVIQLCLDDRTRQEREPSDKVSRRSRSKGEGEQ